MSAYQVCMDGDCWPDTCPVCSQRCAACDGLPHECTCPQLPIDTEDQP